ncbi:rho GTPase-activating protein 26 isoform X2 [Atheta coriaria]|uniref:rho GTPase-activating protein 26 isoform X2 n=1 Tax=Dalotia coriaria TaxID=877792 RepID=UPI0031F42486
MGVGLPPLEFTECLIDSPTFRNNLHKHEKELDNTNRQIKRLIKEVKELLQAAKQLSTCQRTFAKSLKSFTFECIGGTQTDDELVICKSLHEFGALINNIEDERDRMLENADKQVLAPLENFRKDHIVKVRTDKKKFDKQTVKFCQSQERYLNLTNKKQNEGALQEADATVGMEKRHFCDASMQYVCLIQEVHERKKFEFVETLLGFMIGWLTFYHQGYEVAKDFNPYKGDLQLRIQKTRDNFLDYKDKLHERMADIQKQQDNIKTLKGRKEGYLFLLEKKAFGQTWTKHFCTYDKNTKLFTIVPYNQMTSKSPGQPEEMTLSACTRRPSDSIEKRFCFDLEVNSKPGVIQTFQALSEQDRKAWLDIMDGKEPTYLTPQIRQTNEVQYTLDDNGMQFVKRCIDALENRGLEEQGLYRVVGVTSKVTKLLTMGLDRRKADKVNLDDVQEWETKTITSALKSYLRNLPEPLMTHTHHNKFIKAVKNDYKPTRVKEVHKLIYRIPKNNFELLNMLIKHLSNVAAKCDKNLMTTSNLGVCFGPTLLRPEEETVAAIVDLKFYNIVVEILIDNHRTIFTTEPAKDDTQISPSKQLHVQQNKKVNDYQNTMFYDYNNLMKSGQHYPQQSREQLTVRTYCDPTSTNLSSSMYNVHESPPMSNNSIHSMSKSEYLSQPISSNGSTMQSLGSIIAGPQSKFLAHNNKYNNSTSLSESNLPDLQSISLQTTSTNHHSGHGSPLNHYRTPYDMLDNSTESSSESVSSNSRDGGGLLLPVGPPTAPQKRTRLSIALQVPKSYNSQGAVVNNEALYASVHKGRTNSITGGGGDSTSPSKFTGGVRRVRTLYACLGEHDGELSFEPNQIITNVKTSKEPGWLEGTLNGKTGLVPENYVELLD